MNRKLSDIVNHGSNMLKAAATFSSKALEVVFYAHQEPEIFLQDFFKNNLLREAVADCLHFVDTGDAGFLDTLAEKAKEVMAEVDSLQANTEETSGNAKLTESRRRALFAARSVRELIIAATWPRCSDISFSDIHDPAEVDALRRDGYKYHAAQSMELAADALNITSEEAYAILNKE